MRFRAGKVLPSVAISVEKVPAVVKRGASDAPAKSSWSESQWITPDRGRSSRQGAGPQESLDHHTLCLSRGQQNGGPRTTQPRRVTGNGIPFDEGGVSSRTRAR